MEKAKNIINKFFNLKKKSKKTHPEEQEREMKWENPIYSSFTMSSETTSTHTHTHTHTHAQLQLLLLGGSGNNLGRGSVSFIIPGHVGHAVDAAAVHDHGNDGNEHSGSNTAHN